MVPTTSDVWQNWMRWSTAANASPSSSTDEHSSSSYHALLASVKSMGETDTKKKSTLKQIELDLARTFPNDSDFERDGRMIAPLRNILQALSVSMKGYTQGMNFIVGFLLKMMPTLEKEAECYYLSKIIIEEVLSGYYFRDEKFPEWLALKRDLKALDKKTKHLFPRLHKTLSANGFSVIFFCPRWFLCAFIGVLPDEVVKKVWDTLLFHLSTQQRQQQRHATTLFSSGCCSEMLIAFSLTTLSFVQDELDARRKTGASCGDSVDCEAIVIAIRDAAKSIKGEIFMKRFAEISLSSRSSSLSSVEKTKEEEVRKITKTRKRTRYDEDDEENAEEERMKTPKTLLMSSKKYSHLQSTPAVPPIGSAVKRVLTPIANYFFSTNVNGTAQLDQKSPAMKTTTTIAKTPQSSRLKATYAISTNKKRRMETVRNFETPIDDPAGYERDLLELLRAEEHQAMTPVRKITIAPEGDENCCDTIPTMAVGFFSPRAAKELGPGTRRLENNRSPLSPLMSFR